MIIRGLESKSFEGRGRELEMVSPEKRLRSNIRVFNYPTGCKQLFSLATEDKTRSNGFKPHEGRFKLSPRKNFLNVRTAKYWNKLPGVYCRVPFTEGL